MSSHLVLCVCVWARASLSMEYSDLYNDVNQLSLSLQKTELSEVMVVHRMHVRLSDLHMETVGSDKVHRLYVVADVVELPLGTVSIPSSASVVIFCRVLYVPYRPHPLGTICDLVLPRMNVRVVQESRMRVYAVAEDGGTGDIGLYIHADRVIWRQDTRTQIRVMHLFIRGPECTFSAAHLPQPVKATTVRMAVTMNAGQRIPVWESDLQRSDETEMISQTEHVGQIVVEIEGSQRGANAYNPTPAFNIFPIPRRQPVAREVLTDPYIILGLQMNILTAELVQAAHNAPLLIKAVTKHVEWLNNILIEALQVASTSEDLLALLFRAETYLKMATKSHSVVPRLQYHMYSNLIHRMVQVAQAYDDEFQRLKLFIAQNEILGSYLLEQNKALASKEKEMSSFHAQVVSLRRTELNNCLQRMEQLSVQMENESKAMEEAKEDMDKALEAHQRKELARALFAVLGAIGMVALTFVTGGATAPAAVAAAGQAVTAAGALAQGLKRVVEILEGLQALMDLVVSIREIVQDLQSIGQLIEAPKMPEMPSNADWLIFVNEVEAVAEQMPAEVVGSVAVWKAKCRNVAVLGQEMCTMAAHIAELQQQIKLEELLQEIAERQADRLLGISAANLSSFTEMLTQIDMRTTRLLLQLIKLLHIQNAAINYEYLFPASGQLSSWPVRMHTVWEMLLQQESSAIMGLLTLGPSTDFARTYVISDIPVGLLVDGFDWQFVIPVMEDSSTFPIGFSRVRIRHVELKFPATDNGGSVIIHQPQTNNGFIYILLQSAHFFSDRKERVAMDYEASMGLAYPYAYNLTTGVPSLTNIPSDEYANTFMRMTPFTGWRLRLSSSAEENRGLAFPTATSPDDSTQISITFHITAIRAIDFRSMGDEE